MGAIGNEFKKEKVELSKEGTTLVKKSKVVPQYNNGQSMVNILNKHFNYLQSVEKGISSTTGSGHETSHKRKTNNPR